MKAFTAAGLATLTLLLFTAFLGITLGAGVYELRIVVPQWIVQTDTGHVWNADAAMQADTGRRFWVYVTTVPLTLLTLANLVLAVRTRGPLRRWWMSAAVIALADRIFTFSYFIPTLLTLMDTSLPQTAAVPLALQWQQLDLVRQLLSALALISALIALALVGKESPKEGDVEAVR